MAKLVITVPAQVFEYTLNDATMEMYLETPEDDRDDFFDTWISDTWPHMDWEVVD